MPTYAKSCWSLELPVNLKRFYHRISTYLRFQIFTAPVLCYFVLRKLQQVRSHLATICRNPVSGRVPISCDNLMTTSLLEVVNRLVASELPKLVINRLVASFRNKLQQVCKWQVAKSLILTDLLNVGS